MTSISPELYKIAHIALSDPLPEKVDFAYLHAESRDDQDSILGAGARLYHDDITKEIGIDWADKRFYEEWVSRYMETRPDLAETFKEIWPEKDGSIACYSGCVEWTDELKKLGIPEEAITTVEPSFDHYFSTAGEAVGIVKHCINTGIKNLSITSPPIQQTRSLMSVVTALVYADATDINVYSVPGTPLNWQEETTHCCKEIFVRTLFSGVKYYFF